jgi:hypothetical protein
MCKAGAVSGYDDKPTLNKLCIYQTTILIALMCSCKELQVFMNKVLKKAFLLMKDKKGADGSDKKTRKKT